MVLHIQIVGKRGQSCYNSPEKLAKQRHWQRNGASDETWFSRHWKSALLDRYRRIGRNCFSGFSIIVGLEQPANAGKIAAGQVLFEHEWSVNDSLANSGDGLGPVFNGRSCVQCHHQGGVGGSGGSDGNVVSFDVLPDRSRSRVISNVVHHHAVDDSKKESNASAVGLFPFVSVTLTSSTRDIDYSSGCGATPGTSQRAPLKTQRSPVIFHELNSPALFGVGLIDEISSASISMNSVKRTASKLGQEFSGEFDGNSIGMIRNVSGGIGRFGWKGQFASLKEFVASACATELGLSNSLQSQGIPNQYKEDQDAENDMTNKQLNELVAFVRTLPRPKQVLPTEFKALQRVEYGERLFSSIGCLDCHVKDMGNVEAVYTDFQLYNLEDIASPTSGYLTNEIEDEFRFPSSHPEPDDWQTPPLGVLPIRHPIFMTADHRVCGTRFCDTRVMQIIPAHRSRSFLSMSKI